MLFSYFQNKKMLPLTKKELESRQDSTVKCNIQCYIYRKKIHTFTQKNAENINHRKVTGKYRNATHSISNI